MTARQYAERKVLLDAYPSTFSLAVVTTGIAWFTGWNFWVCVVAAFFWVLSIACLHGTFKKEYEEEEVKESSTDDEIVKLRAEIEELKKSIQLRSLAPTANEPPVV